MLNQSKNFLVFRLIVMLIIATMLGAIPIQSGWAQLAISLPAPDQRIHPTGTYDPSRMVGLRIDRQDPFHFYFIMDRGDELLTDVQKKEEYRRLIKHFLTSLTIANKDMWVNLSPYESKRIIGDNFSQTTTGQDLLEQDYVLKQFTSSLIYPDEDLGKSFWKQVYTQAYKKFGTTDIPVNTFNKVWIRADSAEIYQKDDTAILVKSHLKVMLEKDYLAEKKSRGELGNQGVLETLDSSPKVQDFASNTVREIIIPIIEREVNQGKSFATLRQIYNSMILATWYKKTLKASLLGQVYEDQNKVAGVEEDDPKAKERIYKQYLKAFKVGVFNYIKEEEDPQTHEIVPRKYFSGGIVSVDAAILADASKSDAARFLASREGRSLDVVDAAMGAANTFIGRSNLNAQQKDLQTQAIVPGYSESSVALSDDQEKYLEALWVLIPVKVLISQEKTNHPIFTWIDVQNAVKEIKELSNAQKLALRTLNRVGMIKVTPVQYEDFIDDMEFYLGVWYAYDGKKILWDQRILINLEFSWKEVIKLIRQKNDKNRQYSDDERRAHQAVLTPGAFSKKRNAQRYYTLLRGIGKELDPNLVDDKKTFTLRVKSWIASSDRINVNATQLIRAIKAQDIFQKRFKDNIFQVIDVSPNRPSRLIPGSIWIPVEELVLQRYRIDSGIITVLVSNQEEDSLIARDLLIRHQIVGPVRVLEGGKAAWPKYADQDVTRQIAPVEENHRFEKISVPELEELIREQSGKKVHPIKIVDIRVKTLFNKGHIPGAVSIPRSEIEDRIGEFDTKVPTIIVSQYGEENISVIEALFQNSKGERSYYLEGGFREWENTTDLAQTAATPLGGIDLDDRNLKIDVKLDGQGFPLPIQFQDPAMVNISGLVPAIKDIVPLAASNMPILSELSTGWEH